MAFHAKRILNKKFGLTIQINIKNQGLFLAIQYIKFASKMDTLLNEKKI